MTDRELMQDALDAILAAIKAGDWKVDGACDPDMVIERLRARLAQPEQEKTRSEKLRDAGYTRRPKGWDKDDEPEQEPVAWGFPNTGITGSNRWMYLKESIPAEDQYRGVLWTPLYTAPPQREWQGLTDEEIEKAGEPLWWYEPANLKNFARAIEAKLKEKNALPSP